MRRLRLVLVLSPLVALSTAEAKKDKTSPSEQLAAAIAAATEPKVSACDDFYAFACGGWQANTQLPADKSIYVRGFSSIDDNNEELLRKILEDAAANPGDDQDRRQLGDFWSACMDQKAIDAAGNRPIQPIWAKIAAAGDMASLTTLAGELGRMGVDPLFTGYVGADNNNPELNILHLYQGGLSLPERTYYLDQSDGGQQLLQAFETHVAKMLMLGGLPSEQAALDARKVLAFETKLAEISWPVEKVYDSEATNNKIDLAGLQKLAPKLDWNAYFAGSGVSGRTQLNVATPSFFEELDKLLAATPPADLQAVFRWKVVHASAGRLSQDFEKEDFQFFGTRLTGAQNQPDRWKRCVAATDAALGTPLGKAYVAAAFPGESKQIALELITGIQEAFEANLPKLSWMDDATREKASEKLHTIVNKVGFPDKWRDYGGLKVDRSSYFASHLASTEFEVAYALGKWEQPVDRTEWGMTPPTVNAYYNPSANEIAFPAGILQPPFFDRTWPMPMNFGGIGMVMGHEVTHGFDDDGRKFDKTGRLTEWWAPAVSTAFEERAMCVQKQYSTFEVQKGLFVNGELTLGENIADIGGLKESYYAWKAWEDRQDKKVKGLAGFTPDQLFFLSYAQGWCTLSRPEIEKQRVLSDPHSPPRFRVNGAVMNLPEFAEAFGCDEGAPMAPVERCEVW